MGNYRRNRLGDYSMLSGFSYFSSHGLSFYLSELVEMRVVLGGEFSLVFTK